MNSLPERPSRTAHENSVGTACFDSFATETARSFSEPMVSNRAFAIFFIVTMIIVALLLLAPKAGAADFSWNQTTGGKWSLNTNWTPNIASPVQRVQIQRT